jgi:hypothetical protein
MIKGFCTVRFRPGGKAFPRSRKSVSRTDDKVEGKEPDKDSEPYGVVHVKHVKGGKDLECRRAETPRKFGSTLLLRDHCPDNGNDGQEYEQYNGQFN